MHIVLFSIHGLVRGDRIEFGRDPDTGGQVKYVVELARALAAQEDVSRVDLVTRRILDRRVDASYAEPWEPLGPKAGIVRLEFGPRRYLYKENLWPHVDALVDRTLAWLRREGLSPDVLHGHYADGGYVGSQLARILGVPYVFTGHSLGRVKRARFQRGREAVAGEVEERFHFRDRIEAEEVALETAALVVTSTRQEVREQYELYDRYQPDRMEVIPPGVDLDRFRPPAPGEAPPPAAAGLFRFWRDPARPVVMAMARPDDKKNFHGLIRAFGRTPGLRDRANLLLIAGRRSRLAGLDPTARRVLSRILEEIDDADLYGVVAIPKTHTDAQVPEFYRLAARSGGVFVNPAFNEPFGLTLIEAAASGLPVVATRDGGPKDIIETCRNGVLVDPSDTAALGAAIRDAIGDRDQWARWAESGADAARRSYSWAAHTERYLEAIRRVRARVRPGFDEPAGGRSRLPTLDRLVVTDIDNTLTGDREALEAFRERMREAGPRVGFALATGRKPTAALQAVEELGLQMPDLLIASVGTEIRIGKGVTPDRGWRNHIHDQWNPEGLRAALRELPGFSLQPEEDQSEFKISYFLDSQKACSVREVVRHLRSRNLRANVIGSHGAFLDLLPIRATPGLAIRHVLMKLGMPPHRVLVCGDSGNDAEMLRGDTLGVVVGNYSPELEPLRGRPRVYFARGCYAWGILEGIDHYEFFGRIRIPGEEGGGAPGGIQPPPAGPGPGASPS